VATISPAQSPYLIRFLNDPRCDPACTGNIRDAVIALRDTAMLALLVWDCQDGQRIQDVLGHPSVAATSR
jgi:hypothetical protein